MGLQENEWRIIKKERNEDEWRTKKERNEDEGSRFCFEKMVKERSWFGAMNGQKV